MESPERSVRSRSRSIDRKSRNGSELGANTRSVPRSRSRSRSKSRSPISPVVPKSRRYSPAPRDVSRPRTKSRSSASAAKPLKLQDRERENPNPSRCIGVFGLSYSTTESDLKHEFGRFGRLDKVQIIKDGPTRRSRGFGFVYFDELEDAAEARQKMNGVKIAEHTIRVDFSVTRRPHKPTPGVYIHHGKLTKPAGRLDTAHRGGDGRRRERSRRRSPPRDYYREGHRDYVSKDYYERDYYSRYEEQERYYRDSRHPQRYKEPYYEDRYSRDYMDSYYDERYYRDMDRYYSMKDRYYEASSYDRIPAESRSRRSPSPLPVLRPRRSHYPSRRQRSKSPLSSRLRKSSGSLPQRSRRSASLLLRRLSRSPSPLPSRSRRSSPFTSDFMRSPGPLSSRSRSSVFPPIAPSLERSPSPSPLPRQSPSSTTARRKRSPESRSRVSRSGPSMISRSPSARSRSPPPARERPRISRY